MSQRRCGIAYFKPSILFKDLNKKFDFPTQPGDSLLSAVTFHTEPTYLGQSLVCSPWRKAQDISRRHTRCESRSLRGRLRPGRVRSSPRPRGRNRRRKRCCRFLHYVHTRVLLIYKTPETRRDIQRLFMLQELWSRFYIRKPNANGNSLLILSNTQESKKSEVNNVPVHEWVTSAKLQYLEKVTEECMLGSETCFGKS